MVRRDGAEARKERYSKIAQTIHSLLFEAKEQGVYYIPYKITVIRLKVEMGLTLEKILEYMTDLEALSHFEIDEERDQIRKRSV